MDSNDEYEDSRYEEPTPPRKRNTRMNPVDPEQNPQPVENPAVQPANPEVPIPGPAQPQPPTPPQPVDNPPNPTMDPLLPSALAGVLDNNSSTFSGKFEEDATSHFLNFQDNITDLQAIAPEDAPIHTVRAQVNKFKKTLRGKPRLWMEGKNFDTIEELRKAFIGKYGKEPSRSEDMRQLTRAHIGVKESLNEYADRLSEAARRLEFQEEFLVDLFVAGLPSEQQLYVRGKGPRSMERALKDAKEYRDIQKASTISPSANVQFAVQEEKTSGQLSQVIDELKALVIEGRKVDHPPADRGILRKSPERSGRSPARNVRFQQRAWTPNRERSRSPGPYKRDSNAQRRGFSPYEGRGRSPSPGRNNYQRGRSPQRFPRAPPNSRGNTPTRGTSQNTSQQKVCWACGKMGHFYRNCGENHTRTHSQIAEREAMKAFLLTEDQYFQTSHQ